MFCFQCQETAGNKACSGAKGVCGKTDATAQLQDLLLFTARGIAFWSVRLGEVKDTDHDESMKAALDKGDMFIVQALFTTVTNVNFDPSRIYAMIQDGLRIRERIKQTLCETYKQENNRDFPGPYPECATWFSPGDMEEFIRKGEETGVLSCNDEDIRSLRELLVYGLKGIAAYADHASILGYKNQGVFRFIKKALAATADDTVGKDELFSLVVEAGKNAVDSMALLDKANTGTYGLPEMTRVSTGTVDGPGILVSGHDLKDLYELLEQTEGTGVNVYTHGEMLPANAYPGLKKYPQLIGNFGTSWYNQQKEFKTFNGVFLFTTNCLQKPLDSYKDRVYTTGLVGWEGIKHIPDRKNGHPKDFSALIDHAKQYGSIGKTGGKKITIGFHHTQILSLADDIIGAIKSGAIKRFVVMGGCDGRHPSREYFTEYARALPGDTVILTAGCAKFRYNMLDLEEISGIPRVIDAGQCNDSYSLAVIALKLAEVLEVQDINDLPITFTLAWYEQKAVCVLLALLYLGFKNITLGPTLPAFLSPGVVNTLVEQFGINATGTVEEDITRLISSQ